MLRPGPHPRVTLTGPGPTPAETRSGLPTLTVGNPLRVRRLGSTDALADTLIAVLECVVNISEGLRPEVVAAVAAACGPALLDVHSDRDHNRSVLTLAGSSDDVPEAALALARAAIERIDLSVHSGVHPRLGAVDVVPFVSLDDTGPEGLEAAGEVARAWAKQVATELAVPVFLYGSADPEGRSLPDVRRSAFRERRPDFGPKEPHPTAGGPAARSGRHGRRAGGAAPRRRARAVQRGVPGLERPVARPDDRSPAWSCRLRLRR